MVEGHGPLKNIVVLAIIGDGGIWTGDLEVVAQLGEK